MSRESQRVRLTRAQVREIDRLAVERYHVPSIVLMENAAHGAFDEAMKMIDPPTANVIVVCGAGNNGGDGFAVARHLHNAGVRVAVLESTTRLTGGALINQQISRAMGITTYDTATAAEAALTSLDTTLLIDALFGTGLIRPIEGKLETLVDLMNASTVPILAIDVPSGLDCDTGRPLGPCIHADRTVTFVAEKVGFANPESRQYTGDIVVAGIGCPREVIEQVLQ